MKDIIFDDIRAELIKRIHQKTRFYLSEVDFNGEYRVIGIRGKWVTGCSSSDHNGSQIMSCVLLKHRYSGELHEVDLQTLMPELFETESGEFDDR